MPKVTTHAAGNVVSKQKLNSMGTPGEDDENYVLNFRIAAQDSRFDRKAKEWVEDEANFINVTVWGKKARNVDESIAVGNPVVVFGYLKMREGWTNKEQEEMPPSQYIDALNVGIDICVATGESHRKPKGGSSNSNDASGKSASSKAKSAPKKESKPAAKKAADDDFDLDLELDLGDDDGKDDPGF